jgi:hypothetical protein
VEEQGRILQRGLGLCRYACEFGSRSRLNI